MRNALTWLNGSIANVSRETMLIISIYSVLILIISALSMPVIKILLLSDNSIVNIGYNPSVLKLIISVIAVMLASVSVAFIGIISFIGIIAPAISKKIIGTQLKYQFICSSLIGSILLILADIVQRIIFSPTEIPVGILIGMIGAPVFIGLSIGGYGVDKN
jgi:iron complex transport system permease protein